jgi:hypothetical protein
MFGVYWRGEGGTPTVKCTGDSEGSCMCTCLIPSWRYRAVGWIFFWHIKYKETTSRKMGPPS